MKNIKAYYLLLVYLVVLCRPITPVVINMWQHHFNEVEHLLLIHQHYGAQHVQAEITEKGIADQQAATTHTGQEEQVPVHFPVACYNCFNFLPTSKASPPAFCEKSSSTYAELEGPPPRLC